MTMMRVKMMRKRKRLCTKMNMSYHWCWWRCGCSRRCMTTRTMKKRTRTMKDSPRPQSCLNCWTNRLPKVLRGLCHQRAHQCWRPFRRVGAVRFAPHACAPPCLRAHPSPGCFLCSSWPPSVVGAALEAVVVAESPSASRRPSLPWLSACSWFGWCEALAQQG